MTSGEDFPRLSNQNTRSLAEVHSVTLQSGWVLFDSRPCEQQVFTETQRLNSRINLWLQTLCNIWYPLPRQSVDNIQAAMTPTTKIELPDPCAKIISTILSIFWAHTNIEQNKF